MDHYFNAKPSSPMLSKHITVTLAGRTMRLETANGVFSQERLDRATKLLLDVSGGSLPPQGTFLDLGCGWGPVAIAMAIEAPQARVIAVDVNERAVHLTRRNAQLADVHNVEALTPQELDDTQLFDVIWSNPPIRIGKAQLHALLEHYFVRLSDPGTVNLVVSKNLGAASLVKWLNDQPDMTTTILEKSGGLWVTHSERCRS